MKILASAGCGVATLGLIMAFAPTGTTSATLHSLSPATLAHLSPPIPRRPSSQRRRYAVPSPSPCSSDAGDDGDFVGIPAGNSIAGDSYSAVLGGASDLACAEDSTIAGGIGNVEDAQNASGAFIGGGSDNVADGQGDFVGAGYENGVDGYYSFLGAGNENTVSGDYSFGGGGDTNVSSGKYSFFGAGQTNAASGTGSFVGAGHQNGAAGLQSFVGAGLVNQASGNGSFIGAGDYAYAAQFGTASGPGNQATGNDSFIGAGDQNVVGATEAVLGGGQSNQIVSGASEAFIGGGQSNVIGTSAGDGVVAGGNNNDVTGAYGAIGGGSGNKASGAFAIVPGGADNEALGAASFAAGYHAEAAHNGSFVWSDDVSGSHYAVDGNVNEFVVRASGGTYFFSNEGESVGVKLAAGSGAWASTSDRNEKTHVVPLDDASILAKVSALPVDAWQYKTEAGVRHVGPMAQDFYAAFGVGEDDKHITSIDEDGIALAAIKALHSENGRLRRDNVRLQSRLAALETKVDALASARLTKSL